MGEGSMLADELKYADLSLTDLAGDGSFSGYASLFGEVDLGKDMIERGAFSRSLQKRGAEGVRMLFQHDPSEPIGAWRKLREDGRGLYVEGVLSPDVARAREVHALMKSGGLDGLSIGFQTVRAKTDAKTGVRRVLEADLWEISIVTFPMLPSARIASVKQAGDAFPTIREFERWLTRDAGLSRKAARRFLTGGYDALVGGRDAAGGDDEMDDERLLGLLRRARRMMSS
ncbi:HK97 family phage prohead protease [Martelella lutilitoris]|uniref:HK97 family phage prohead protease n=1 Tax=Martelella lutilitoris TaxID=2583532 RepID=A0A5C4JP06_9HYPH|nr:HK97 family phage prohead protease [Martelella lutilitoris]TNB47030.1 HK97 family phage prohead protease [Martelella lutilitoris]